RRWWVLSWLCCLLGMGTKEVMVSAPVIVLLYDRTFASGTFREAWKRHRRFHLALAGTWIPLVLLALRTGTRGGTSGFGRQAMPLAYYATQPRALVRYLGQCFWPRPLIFDYGTQWVHSAAGVVPYAIVLAALALLTVAALRRWPAAGFLGTFSFAILSVTSLVPGARQTSAEQRMYLPLAAVLALVVCGAYRLAAGCSPRFTRRAAPIAVGVLAIVLAAGTFRRNRDYRSAVALYADNLRKAPGNAFAHDDLAVALARHGQLAEALPQYRDALRLNPGMINAYEDLANACRSLGRLAEAEAACRGALNLNPNYAPARYTLGLVYLKAGRKADAEAQFNDTVLLDPSNTEAWARLRALRGSGR
ncbi:MAG: tetratricopeptide repeat protein, partial [Opitutaceae bacterium]